MSLNFSQIRNVLSLKADAAKHRRVLILAGDHVWQKESLKEILSGYEENSLWVGEQEADSFPSISVNKAHSWLGREKQVVVFDANTHFDADAFAAITGIVVGGLEAMAAGCAVVSALVGGNESYMFEGHNILRAEYEDVEDHGLALQMLAGDASLRTSLVDAGRRTISSHSLERERRSFSDFVLTLAEHHDPAQLASPLTRSPYDE